jgi:putative ABC transport system permease protein
MGIPILAGRGFRDSDREGTEFVTLVTAATARRWWPGENPIGKHLKYTWLKEWRTVVGVVGDTRDTSLAGDPDWLEGHFYIPFTQAPLSIVPRMTLLVKTAGDPLLEAQPLRQVVAAIRDDVPFTQVRSMEEVISDSLTTPRSTMWLLFSFATLALVLSSVGIYAVVAYTVAQRTREIGIRMALGARAQEIVRGILGRSLAVTGAGLAMGLAGAFAATRVLRSFLFHVTATDTFTFVAMPLVLLAVALIATWVPARRASRVDPAVTLRYE